MPYPGQSLVEIDTAQADLAERLALAGDPGSVVWL